ncbi:unnamed protein product [Arctia plantaginis]|uniref:Pro-resilin-like n=1 Tax=Arctia plantaginis TaxID=874455 RepID=A0A8S1BCE4_ARCPL|nr:unnamed protein product [Arctia plantaginis]
MKNIVASMFVIAFVYAELPPNSYLPPPPSNRNGAGYPHGPSSALSQNFAPQVVAARTLEGAQNPRTGPVHGAHIPQSNPFGRSNHASLSQNQAAGNYAASRFANEESGYDSNAANFARNAIEERNSEPANYNFGYMVNDFQEGTDFGHHEERQEKKAQGEYHVVLPDGRKQTVSYEADERGFKPQISYEDSEDLARSSGYDSNANNVRNGGNHDGHFGKNGGHDTFGSRSNGY